ncbi:hypothetical protein [Bradyrhizobium canariense]|uniref:hypothetical protein n=1 Tax=Bradyrhizobium canariense TaxID=255045 RepID=UPI001AECA4FD|nr:hypothetical protein [Bradyrhizobium canariense]
MDRALSLLAAWRGFQLSLIQISEATGLKGNPYGRFLFEKKKKKKADKKDYHDKRYKITHQQAPLSKADTQDQ